MQGVVEIRKSSTLEWIPARLDDSLCENDALRTAANSRATLQIQEETFMVLHERSTVRFTGNSHKSNGVLSHLLNLFSGEAYFRSRRPRELGIETPFVNAMHEGTEFLVKVNVDSAQVVVFDGVVVASNPQGTIRVTEGQSALAKKGQAPVIGPRIQLRDAVQWTLYYPPVIDYAAYSKINSWQRFKPVLDGFLSNDLAGAIHLLDKFNQSQRNADYHILYASLLLTVGQVTKAQQQLKQVQQSQQNTNVLALQSIIALAKEDRQQALQLAQQAQQLDPNNATADIALSYAYQAVFDIDKALDSARQAVDASPDNGLAWARVSELELATGDVGDSMQAASKAQSLNPRLAKTNIVLGFARLAELKLSDAEQSFRTAIKRDPSDPLARLGLGLAKIRQGHVKSGTKEMETAANLDLDNALIRSYLGKAYYEQRRGDIASTEYAIAKNLDPNDPTPWFYDAIYKQTVNRPVEALHAMQKAIELNDNRAVFRSKLLLDSDLAARSSSLGRIYNDIGFQQRGLLEGWKSVNDDPGNYSAHRLLADNYAALQGHEVARVSELLRSQLLQPVNITPVQPQLAESNLLLLDGLGPVNASFTEFNPLFARNRFNLQASGLYGVNETLADEVTHSGLWNKFSYSLGQLHYETDGARKNNSLNQNIYNAFGQFSFSSHLSFQAEYRYKNTVNGDLQSQFDRNNFDRNLRQRFRRHSVRVGLNIRPSNTSSILLSSIYNADEMTGSTLMESNLPGPPLGLSIKGRSRSVSSELQYIKSFGFVKIVAGGGYTIRNSPEKVNLLFPAMPNFPDLTQRQRLDFDATHTNTYFYSYWPLKHFKGIVGFSYDAIQGHDRNDRRRINPKAGLMWNITESTILRFAYFESLTRLSAAKQTIEPTQIAGFNQFFDEIEGTVSRRIGIGLDKKFNNALYSGLELSHRRLDVPLVQTTGDPSGKTTIIQGEEKQREIRVRSYLYWTPLATVTLSAEYFLDIRDRQLQELSFKSIPGDITTHQVPLAISYFSPGGFFAKLKSTFVFQHVKPASVTDADSNHGRDNFVSIDTVLGYRLPKRRGIIEFGVRNLLDEQYQYAQINIGLASPDQTTIRSSTPRFVPERTIFGRFIFNLDF